MDSISGRSSPACIWLIYHRLWWALLGYVVLSIAGEVALSMLKVDLGARFVVMLLFALLMGFEAASLRRWTLSRGKWRQLDVVVADNKDAAERRFFDRWTAQHNAVNDQWASDRGGPPPTRHVPSQFFHVRRLRRKTTSSGYSRNRE